jgi:sugar (pentulose or hexulose) kinase
VIEVVRKIQHCVPDMRRVVAVASSAQQHGTVFCGPAAALSQWVAAGARSGGDDGSVVQQLFRSRRSAMWMDASTGALTHELHSLVAPARLAALTGSPAHLRFSGMSGGAH